MNEKMCPLCSKPIRSDATIKHYCKLCGMYIDDTEPSITYTTRTGEPFRFLSVYTTTRP